MSLASSLLSNRAIILVLLQIFLKSVEICTTLEYFAKKEMERILFPSPDDTEMVDSLVNIGTTNDDAKPKISNYSLFAKNTRISDGLPNQES